MHTRHWTREIGRDTDAPEALSAGSCEGERRSKAPGVCPSGWRAAPAAEPLGAWHVTVSVSRGDASDRRLVGSARVGVHRHVTRIRRSWWLRKRLEVFCSCWYYVVYIGTRNAEETREPVGSSRECGGCAQRKRWMCTAETTAV